ncbi:hypothetical protein ACJ73_05594 [Blastomyces percursus]|uniref:Uncharacterized protein n=1 Tax=Blastomyces percursus TaxID=1658174 RepID=A0A1J9QS65_9EURO|nr:hypothetical protein ACJ73_05594 [Blastomyces percursus]
MEERRPWPEIERCFPGRTESALRQRVSTLRKQERGMRTAEPAGIPAASASPGGLISQLSKLVGALDTDLDVVGDRHRERLALDYQQNPAKVSQRHCGSKDETRAIHAINTLNLVTASEL